MFERVIVAVDGGAAGDAALEWVVQRSRSVTMKVEIATVVESDVAEPSGSPQEKALHAAERRLAAAAPQVKLDPKTLRGFPAPALIEESLHGDLLVIGTHKTAPLAGIAHGTLPLKVAGHAACTTVVVPFDWTARVGPVVVGWDDDRTSDTALDLAAAEAHRGKLPLVIVHAWRAPVAAGVEVAGSGEMFETLAAAHLELLTTATHRIRKAYPELVVTTRLENGPAAIALVKAAEGASIAIVGSRGRGALLGLVLGSVSHDLLMNMPAPVAVVPHVDEPVDVYPELVDEDLL